MNALEKVASHEVSLENVGGGNAYVLGADEGMHSLANTGLRTLLARTEDTHGDFAVMMSSGDENSPTMPHYHRHTTEAFLCLAGVVRVWLDDQHGTRIVRDVKAGEFALLPRGWVHAWQFAAPKSKQFGIIAPAGFEKIVNFLNPDNPGDIERLRESETHIDVVWMPDFPLFDEPDKAS